MEERVPPPPPIPDDPHHHETYVIQIPKDQIYRVPPPENALIVQRYRKPLSTANAKSNTRGGSCCCCGWVSCVLLVLVLLVVGIVASSAGLFSVFTKARDPVFHVESFRARNVTGGGNEFDFGLTASNPNKYRDVVYKQGGTSSLAFRGKKIATGKFPSFLQERKSSSDVRITLRSSLGGKSPPEIASVMSSSRRKGRKQSLSFTLRVMVTARMDAGFFQRLDVDLSVSCDYAVDELTGGTKILSEECVVTHL